MPVPLCDMTLDELRDERRRLQKNYRRAAPWSAELDTAKQALDACDAWMKQRVQEPEAAHG
ncbi:hypothetical protein PBC5_gp54 [Sinorhizobium phage PBC5]|uniref:hypothetical protein n=1 Tax=Sinorhizobium phage PBC5 TaxID=179237 RepID=UPI001BECA3A2|nr:hypothetical protein PBC5_gp54 [Sinorhizobium phage PBC5]